MIDSASSTLLHRAISACARRLAATGVLPSADEVCWLHAHEIALALRRLAPGPAHWPALVAARQALHAWQQQLTPPPTLGAPPPAPAEPAGGAQPAQASAATASDQAPPENLLVTGQLGSAGVATGRVRLVSHEDLVPDVAAGDVLVARNAGPLWSPVFPTIAAVVLDQGALFQHAMLTCREYGVPAVFQTKDATQRLLEGQRVTVDGNRGWVLGAD